MKRIVEYPIYVSDSKRPNWLVKGDAKTNTSPPPAAPKQSLSWHDSLPLLLLKFDNNGFWLWI